MDHQWFRLDTPPFDDQADARHFHSTEDREAVLGQLMQHVQLGKGIALLVAESGLGKTMLMRALLLRLHATDHAVLLPWTSAADRDVIRETCKRFSVGLPFSKDRSRTAKRLRAHLQKTWEVGHRSILIIDQAESLSANHLSQLAEFVAGSTNEAESLRIVLSGRPMLSRVLERTEFAQFRQQISVTCTLRSMNAAETSAFLTSRLLAAGHSTGELFEPEAAKLIHDISGGVPRSVNAAAIRAMQAARFAGEKRIRAVRISTTARVTPAVSAPIEAIQPSPAIPVVEPPRESWGIMGSLEGHVAQRSREVAMSAARGVLGASEASEFAMQADGDSPNPIGEMGRGVVNDAEMIAGVPRFMGDAGLASLTVERLEQLLIRAERVVSLLDESVRESVGASERLTYARDRAEQLTERLSHSAEQASQTLVHVRQRSDEVIDETDRRVTDVRGQIANVFETLADAEPLRRIQQVCTRVDEIETRLNTFSDQVAQKAEEQLARMGKLAEKIDLAEQIQKRLEVVVARAEGAQGQVDGTLKSVRSTLDEAIASADTSRKKIVEDVHRAVKGVREDLAGTTTELERRIEGLRTGVKETTRQITDIEQRTIAGAIDRVRKTFEEELARRNQNLNLNEGRANEAVERLAEASRSAEAMIGSVRQSLASINDGAVERLSKASRSAETAVDSASQAFASIKNQATEAITNLRTATSTVEAKSAELERSWAQKSEKFTAESKSQIDTLSSRVDELQKVTESARAQVVEAIEAAKRDFAELTMRHKREIDELQHYANALEGRHGQLRFKFTELTEQAETIAAKAGQWEARIIAPQKTLEHWIDRGESVGNELTTSVKRAEDLQNGTKEAVGRLETLRHAVSSTLVDLGAAYERVKPLTEQVSAATTLSSTLQAACEDARQTNKQVVDVVSKSKQWQETVRQICTLTDEKSRQLDSHHAAATHTLRQLTDATINGQKLVSQVTAVVQDVEALSTKTQEQIGKLTQDLWSLSTTAETRVTELNTATTRTTETMQKITALSTEREAMQQTLAEQVRLAQEQVRSIQEHTTQSSALAERLSAVTPLIRMAQETRDSIKQSLDDASRLHADMVAVMNGGTEQCAELQKLSDTARTLIDTQQQVLRRVEEAVDSLNERLEEGRGTVEASERLRREFTAQAEDIRKNLDAMRRQAAEVEEKVTAIVTKPQEVIATAQNQAAQLERVCGVVRKVFAGLSQSSLEAVQKTKDFKQISDAATERVTQLNGETDRATATLHEWVAEAVRVQSRLEKLLQQAPSITATHPGDTLLSVSQKLQKSMHSEDIKPSIASMPTGELRTLPATNATPPVTAAAKGLATTTPAVPNDRIAAMIEEAKEAALVRPG